MFFLSNSESSSDYIYWKEGISTQMISVFSEQWTSAVHCEISHHFFEYDNNFKCTICSCRIENSLGNPRDDHPSEAKTLGGPKDNE